MRDLSIRFKETAKYAYYQIMAFWPIWYYILNRKGRMIMVPESELSDLQKRLARDLQTNGIAFTSLDELFPDERILDRLTRYSDELSPNKIQREKKSFLYEYWNHTPVIDLEQPFVRTSLSRTVLSMIGSYMETAPKFFYFMLNEALPLVDDEARTYSQNWHRDPDDIRMCKMFIYLTDVGAENGPFEYMRGSQRSGRWNHIYRQERPHGRYPPIGAIEKLIPPDEIVQCIGKAGTVIFCDTAGLHRGGYVKSGKRIMYTAGYVSAACPRGILYLLPEHFSDTLKTISDPYQRYALENRYAHAI